MIIVGGATATGKSAFAEEIARRIGGELISADGETDISGYVEEPLEPVWDED